MKPKQIPAAINNKPIHITRFNTYQNTKDADVCNSNRYEILDNKGFK